jgi:hypothetical protein
MNWYTQKHLNRPVLAHWIWLRLTPSPWRRQAYVGCDRLTWYDFSSIPLIPPLVYPGAHACLAIWISIGINESSHRSLSFPLSFFLICKLFNQWLWSIGMIYVFCFLLYTYILRKSLELYNLKLWNVEWKPPGHMRLKISMHLWCHKLILHPVRDPGR